MHCTVLYVFAWKQADGFTDKKEEQNIDVDYEREGEGGGCDQRS
jgi:hypothetical protein